MSFMVANRIRRPERSKSVDIEHLEHPGSRLSNYRFEVFEGSSGGKLASQLGIHRILELVCI